MSRLSVRFQHQYAGGFGLDVAFETAAPTTSLFGPSGSGKSSALAIIAGLLRPARGYVALDDVVWVDTESRLWQPPEQRRIGMVFQEPLLFPHLSVADNLRYGERRRPGGATRRIGWDRVIEVLELAPLLRRRPRNLSGGERQRVGLGRALLRDPELLLLDEPLVALDEPLKERILAYLDRVLREWRVPTLYVSHSQAEVRRLAQWVVAIQNGKAVASGPVEEVLGSGLEALSNGAFMPMNLLCVEPTERLPGGGWTGRLGLQSVQLPEGAEPPVGNRCYVQFTPQAVNLGVGQAADGWSARNRLSGTIDRVLPHGSAVFVLVDVGQPIWAEVTPEAVSALGLKPGTAVTCLIKTTAMQIIP